MLVAAGVKKSTGASLLSTANQKYSISNKNYIPSITP
jgi:hypothetical protein